MLLNHIANIFLVPGTLWYEVLVDIGYFTAITMCYFLVEGFRYTHSRKQYALRLFGFGVVSQVPFSMAFAQNGILEFQDFNMMFTLFLCFCILLCIETIRNRFLRGVLIVLLILGSLFCDWALLAPVFTLLFAWAGGNRTRQKAAFGAAALLYGGMAGLGSGQVWEAVGCAVPILVSAFVILYLYNGRRAARGRTFYKWFFYAFYPAHLLVLGLISWHTPVAYLGGLAVLELFYTLATGGEMTDVLYALLSGGVILGAFFMATDYVTTPMTGAGKLIFGLGCAVLTFVIREFANMPEGCSFSILLMNLLTPYIDKLTMTHPFGAKPAVKKEAK